MPSLKSLVDHGYDVVGAITRVDAPLGRKRILTPSDVAAAAESMSIPVHKTNRPDDATVAWVRDLEPDLGVIVAYGGVLKDPLLSLPKLGWINLHFSDLPRLRGAAPVQRALGAGEQHLGVTVFRLVEELDAGPVLARDSKEFSLGTPAGMALEALADFGTAALVRAVAELQTNPHAGEPQTGDATYAHKLVREDGRLNLARPVSELLAHWAGVTPEPGAYVEHDSGPLKLHAVHRFPGAEVQVAKMEVADTGALVTLVDGDAVLHLEGGALVLDRVQPAGKLAMDGAAWLRGRGGSTVVS